MIPSNEVCSLKTNARRERRAVRFATTSSAVSSRRHKATQLVLSEDEMSNMWYSACELDHIKARLVDDARTQLMRSNSGGGSSRKRCRADETPSTTTPSPREEKTTVPTPAPHAAKDHEHTIAQEHEVFCTRGLEFRVCPSRKRQRRSNVRATLGAQDKLRTHLNFSSATPPREMERAAEALATYCRRRTSGAAEAARCAGHADFLEAYWAYLECAPVIDTGVEDAHAYRDDNVAEETDGELGRTRAVSASAS